MLLLVVGVVAALFVGVVVGFGLRGSSARRDLDAARAELAQARAESATRAGFERLAEERFRTIEQLTAERNDGNKEVARKTEIELSLSSRVSELEAELRKERESTAEKIALLDRAEKTLGSKFEVLAGEILEKKSKSFSEGSQKEIGTLLDPLKIQIKEFRERVEKAQLDSTVGVTELKTLIGNLGELNRELSTEAHNLSTALRRDTKAQGNWGETILRNILDKSGLQEGIHYSFQESFTQTNADGEPLQRRQTDVIVKLPGGRHLIIDSKVSLNAYNDSVNAETDLIRAEALKKHRLSVRNHFNELASRNYQNLLGMQSPDFVVMFVPIEPAFLLALQSDDSLWQDAYEKGVLLSGPTTVLFVIRIVRDLWRQEDQARDVKKVMERGSELYDKFVGFVNNLESVGSALANARQSYEDASRQLSTGPGNLIRQVEMLRALAQVNPKSRKKQIPQRLLDSAEADEPTLALAAEAEEGD